MTTTAPVPTLPRSFLYVPATRPELFANASSSQADALILDLEDAVPVTHKSAARRSVRQWLTQGPDGTGSDDRPAQWVRVNAESVDDDLEAVTHPALDGVFLAKCSPSALDELAAALERLEPERGLTAGSLKAIGLVESAHALLQLAEMAQHPRLLTFGIGEVDLLADLRMTRTERSAAALDSLRSQIILHCAAAQLAPPVAPTSTAFRDLDAFADSTRHLHDLGFRSRTAIHPAQVPVIHTVLTPDTSAVESARDVMARFDAAGAGVTTDADGRMIDAAVIRQARETLGRADLLQGQEPPDPDLRR
ncbi:MAG: CoA ester lyase [Propionibacteriales bacterium]|nr:CoA ester lyase [Propionibacteriales bacterium]